MASFATSESERSADTMLLNFNTSKAVEHIQKVSKDTTSFEFVVSAHLRMSGVYWGFAAMSALGKDLMVDMRGADVVEWVMSCYHSDSGGFGGNIDHDAHILYTLSALQILAMCNALHKIDRLKVIEFITSLQQSDGSVVGDKWGEVDTRFSYCALQALALLQALPSQKHHTSIFKAEETSALDAVHSFDVDRAVAFVRSCRNFDGGFGAVPGAESHAGQIFCCVAALSIAGALDAVDRDLLSWWLAERQCDSGGLNGRPEKQSDVCYSWWILSALSILGRTHWIDRQRLVQFILACQDPDDGGISDRPGNMADIFHTFFGIAGLSLLGYFSANKAAEADPSSNFKLTSTELYAGFREIDPTYALPKQLVLELGLPHQVLSDA